MKLSGFTLIELLVVVMIVSVLTAIAVPQYRRTMDRSKAAEAMEVLPALFEARERWVIEHQCTWASGSIVCNGASPSLTVKKLDIELAGSATLSKCPSGTSWETDNFCYALVAGETNQACVKAVPKWGDSRNLTSAAIWYRGDKFSCNGDDDACDILNVADDSHRTGCQ